MQHRCGESTILVVVSSIEKTPNNDGVFGEDFLEHHGWVQSLQTLENVIRVGQGRSSTFELRNGSM